MVSRYGLYLAWVVALLASVGSLYYSRFAHLSPCNLCWYQRSMVFSLAIILGIAAYRRDRNVIPYAGALAALGSLIALYQILQHYFPRFGVNLCGPEHNCSNSSVYYFGFLSIPLMSFIAFILILVFLYQARKGFTKL